MTRKPVRVGVAGLGRSGWSIHALAIEAHPSFQLVAVTDPEPERRREATERFGCRAYDTYEGLVCDPDVELVVVATPSHLHAPMSCAALSAGKHVLVEKPMALNVGEADAMLSCACQSGKVLTVFQIRRLDPDFLKIQEILRSNVLGPIHAIRMAVYGYDRRRDWQTLTKFGGGQLNNTGSHFVDQALMLAGGEWRQLFVDMRRVAYAGDAEDHVKLVFKGRGGVVVDIEMGVSAFSLPHWLIMGKYGSLLGDGNRLEWKYYDPASLAEPKVSEGPVEGRRYGSGESIPWITKSAEIPSTDTTPLFYDRLYRSLRQGAPLLVPPGEIRNLVALFEACRAG
ncbi:MAG TPA: Gfo/Idh/MocA family oxidoreductase [Chthonomonadales bacterium]|nr:Gfo/Idh/MocA family oxidoreductase [Chthonomonadales bacterium]